MLRPSSHRRFRTRSPRGAFGYKSYEIPLTGTYRSVPQNSMLSSMAPRSSSGVSQTTPTRFSYGIIRHKSPTDTSPAASRATTA